MATIASCVEKSIALVSPRITLAEFLTRLGGASDIKSKIQNYELYDQEQIQSIDEIERKYILLMNDDKVYSLSIQKAGRGGERYVHVILHLGTVCRYISKPKLATRSRDLHRYVFIIPHYNNYCRATLRPYTRTVMRQLLKALACLQKREMLHKNIGPESITWRWNKRRNKPHIYLINFAKTEDGDNTVVSPYIHDINYDKCEYDLRHAGVLMLELLLDQDICPLYPNCLIPIEARQQYYARIGCPVTCDLLEELIGGDPIGRITAKEALKHKFFWSKYAYHFVNMM